MTNQMPPRGPDYSMSRPLRGFPGFEDYYQGLSRKTPIALCDYANPYGGRDQLAAQNYAALSQALAAQAAGAGPAADAAGVDGLTSPNLLQGVPVTFGANVMVALPRMPLAFTTGVLTYQLVWRLRSPAAYALNGLPYHSLLGDETYVDALISSDDGWDPATAVFSGKAAQRAVIASFSETIRVPEAAAMVDPFSKLQLVDGVDLGIKPIAGFGWDAQFPSGEGGFPSDYQYGPILPFVGGNGMLNTLTNKSFVYGEFGQNPIATTGPAMPAPNADGAVQFRNTVSHITYTTRAKGDELIVLVNMSVGDGDPATYDFDSPPDSITSTFFGRGGYATPKFPKGLPFGVYIIQGYD